MRRPASGWSRRSGSSTEKGAVRTWKSSSSPASPGPGRARRPPFWRTWAFYRGRQPHLTHDFQRLRGICRAGGNGRYDQVALVYDVRTASSFTRAVHYYMNKLKRAMDAVCRMLFLEAYGRLKCRQISKRPPRRHPLAAEVPIPWRMQWEELALMALSRSGPDFVIDTSALYCPAAGANCCACLIRRGEGGMTVSVLSLPDSNTAPPMEAGSGV